MSIIRVNNRITLSGIIYLAALGREGKGKHFMIDYLGAEDSPMYKPLPVKPWLLP